MVIASNPSYRLVSDHLFASVWHNIESDQKAFFAQRPYKPGEALSSFSAGEILDHPSYLTVQLDEERHILLEPEYLQYINHSCSPNVFFDTSSFQIIALTEIAAGDEMTFFYPSTEWQMAQPFQCTCGTAECIGLIAGASGLPLELLQRYRLSELIQRLVSARNSVLAPTTDRAITLQSSASGTY